MTAGQAVNLVAQGRGVHIVKHGISLFTYGKGGDKNGIAIHAASGKVSAQSQSGATRLTADKALTVASISKSITVAAKTHVLLTAQGACLKLEGGNISLHCPGQVDFKATAKELAGPQHVTMTLPVLPHADNIGNTIELMYHYDDLEGIPHAPYRVTFEGGNVLEGKLDSMGKAVLTTVPPGPYTVEFGEDPRTWSPPPDDTPAYKDPAVQAQAKADIEAARRAMAFGEGAS
jgi:type VI secretion system secreted protein VgrG